ncbi:hypothetical protein LTR08_004433 [Meristemomyces frigidus]|nr:hypothetical protein LTR08_004433 [Meristemomyces frigidus]
MSFLSGPECSTAANPLAQFQKQSAADTSLQRDRLAARGGQALAGGFRSQQQGGGAGDAGFAEFQQQQQGLGVGVDEGAGGYMDVVRREQERRGGAWAGEFGGGAQQAPFTPEAFAQARGGAGAAFNAQEFAQFRQQPQPLESSLRRMPGASFAPMSGQLRASMAYGGGGGYGMLQQPTGFQQALPMQQEVQQQGKGKGRVMELSDTDWERQFEELSTEDTGIERDEELLEREAERAVEEELNGLDRDMMADSELAGHFGDEYDQWKDFDGMNHEFDGVRSHDFSRGPEMGNYLFEENNLFSSVPNAFEEGQKIVREGGNLSLAALAFEAAVQKQPDFVDAWVALGQAQAQNEKEAPAIRALEQALTLDPQNLESLMGLSVSYTNEGYDSLAYRTLERWIGVKYPALAQMPPGGMGSALGAEEEEQIGFTDRHLLHARVSELFLEAAQLNPEGGALDVDVQVGLGVLFYGSEEYDKAVDCFTAALQSVEHGALKREGEEHLLWNRLGATLANSGRSEEAVDAYTRALELRPNFVRARYNLGVSCINLDAPEAAAGHLLNALSMHRLLESEGRAKAAELLADGSGNAVDDAVVEGLLQQNQSTNLYDTLRRVFTTMRRRDLAELVGPEMQLEGLREGGEEAAVETVLAGQRGGDGETVIRAEDGRIYVNGVINQRAKVLNGWRRLRIEGRKLESAAPDRATQARLAADRVRHLTIWRAEMARLDGELFDLVGSWEKVDEELLEFRQTRDMDLLEQGYFLAEDADVEEGIGGPEPDGVGEMEAGGDGARDVEVEPQIVGLQVGLGARQAELGASQAKLEALQAELEALPAELEALKGYLWDFGEDETATTRALRAQMVKLEAQQASLEFDQASQEAHQSSLRGSLEGTLQASLRSQKVGAAGAGRRGGPNEDVTAKASAAVDVKGEKIDRITTEDEMVDLYRLLRIENRKLAASARAARWARANGAARVKWTAAFDIVDDLTLKRDERLVLDMMSPGQNAMVRVDG